LPELPVVSGQEARRAFERLGWIFRRQTGPEHTMMAMTHMITYAIARERRDGEAPAEPRRTVGTPVRHAASASHFWSQLHEMPDVPG